MKRRWLALLLLCLPVLGQTTVTVGGNWFMHSSVKVTWIASVTPSVTYSVYRGEQSGGPYAKIVSGMPCCVWFDLRTQVKHNYWYVMTAVDGSNNESSYSNETQEAQVP